MKTILIILSLLILTTYYSLLNSTLWEIKQDGSGDFTTITEGIDAADDGDTLLVYPGRYIENLNYKGKAITITSLYGVTSDDRSIVRETIIDGNREGTVVVFNSDETRSAILNGFTVTNGLGEFHWFVSTSRSYGGGIYIVNASPVISNCDIEYNSSFYGGGLTAMTYRSTANPLLKGNRIRYNSSQYYGAVNMDNDMDIEFCTQNLNSIYMNYGGHGADITIGGRKQSPVVLDTLTVQNPDYNFVAIYDDRLPPEFTFTFNYSKIDPVAADLYVSPDGCDTNSGLTPDDPLQTIALAIMLIKPDSLQQRTIHVAEGIYSRSLNNQRFPLQIRSYVDIIGADMETTVFDLQGETAAFFNKNTPNSISPAEVDFKYTKNYALKNLTIINGGNPYGGSGVGAIRLNYNSSFSLENITIAECHTGSASPERCGRWTVGIYHGTDITLKNLHLYNNSGYEALRIATSRVPFMNVYGENIRIRKHTPGPLTPDYRGGEGGGASFYSRRDPTEGIYLTLVNLEITDCVTDNIEPMWGETARSNLVVYGEEGGEFRLINATIGNNYSAARYGASAALGHRNSHHIINSIIYGNHPAQLFVSSDDVTISHSVIQNKEAGITYFDPDLAVHWGEGNIDADPLWVGKDVNPDYPYMLSKDSPARGAGTLDIPDLPDFEFPEYDLAGNPRIVDGKIDMGAYQYYKPTTSIEDEEREGVTERLRDGEFNLRNFPNPVTYLHSERQAGQTRSSTGTTISFEAPESGEVVIEIYNVKGQFVRRVFDAYITKGEYNVFWDGKDERGRYVATGFYMYNLHFNDELVATGRATFIK